MWLATQNHSTLVTDTTVVPFLPVNPEYSSTRNQASFAPFFSTHIISTALLACVFIADIFYFLKGRQKLARFSAHEFATLVIDILTDAKRRQWGNSCESPKGEVPSRSSSFFYFCFLSFCILTAAPGAISQAAGGQHVPRSCLIRVAACSQRGARF